MKIGERELIYELIWEDRGLFTRFWDTVTGDEYVKSHLDGYSDPRFESIEYALDIFSDSVVFEVTGAAGGGVLSDLVARWEVDPVRIGSRGSQEGSCRRALHRGPRHRATRATRHGRTQVDCGRTGGEGVRGHGMVGTGAHDARRVAHTQEGGHVGGAEVPVNGALEHARLPAMTATYRPATGLYRYGAQYPRESVFGT